MSKYSHQYTSLKAPQLGSLNLRDLASDLYKTTLEIRDCLDCQPADGAVVVCLTLRIQILSSWIPKMQILLGIMYISVISCFKGDFTLLDTTSEVVR
jgi:hypothetical protein